MQIYVDDIIFSATNVFLHKEFTTKMYGEFEMSMIVKLNFFLGLQIKQSKDDIFISQSKYTKEVLKRFDMDKSKPFAMTMIPITKT